MNRKSESGVALVTTLLMLSLVTFISVAFLSLSQRERASVVTYSTIQQTRFLAEAGEARAQATILARLLRNTNRFDYDLMVSTNIDGRDTNSFNPLATNMINDPRPPVFFDTNATTITDPLEHRFWLDFNRNGRYEATGVQPEVDDYGNTTGFSHYYGGDPEWIGVLEHADQPHSGTNLYVGRYAWLALPAGKSLDVNFIHNQSKLRSPTLEGYVRNHGAGNWEINLAAFLRQLNTNIWGYGYNSGLGGSAGLSFQDALEVTRHQYYGDYNNLTSVSALFGSAGATAFLNDYNDGYGNGPLMLGIRLPRITDENDVTTQPWFGSVRYNPIYEVQDFFDSTTGYSNFVSRMRFPAVRTNSYDRYTYYRLLSQLGTDSVTPLSTRIHLNYNNVFPNAPTNFVEWGGQTYSNFFLVAAERLLKKRFGYSVLTPVDNIPVWSASDPTVTYPSEVHQTLQLVANISEARTNLYYPSVYRPVFTNDTLNGVISILTYEEETNANFVANPWRDLNVAADRAALGPNDNVYGVPVVIAAKKGFPNFNEFVMQTTWQLTRRIQGIKADTNATTRLNRTNVAYEVAVANRFGVEAWNSYMSDFTQPLRIELRHQFTGAMTNEFGNIIWPETGSFITLATNYSETRTLWPAASPLSDSAGIWRWTGTLTFMPRQLYFPNTADLFRPATNLHVFQNPSEFPSTDWGLTMTNRLSFFVIDTSANRVIDFVSLNDMTSNINLSEAIEEEINGQGGNELALLWRQDRLDGSTNTAIPTFGVQQQMLVSLGLTNISQNYWQNYTLSNYVVSPAYNNIHTQIVNFAKFANVPPGQGLQGVWANMDMPVDLDKQAPFSPTLTLRHSARYQVNDPLVHYTRGDLLDPQVGELFDFSPPVRRVFPTNEIQVGGIGYINQRYRPWGGRRRPGGPPLTALNTESDLVNDPRFDVAVKDPLIRWSDDWDFPTNDYGNVGWLGRVHRGTPWQTVYFKAPVSDPDLWFNWAGNRRTHPTNDWELAEHFTVALNESSIRGLLSVNQTNQAAWAAVMGGIQVLSNATPDEIITNNILREVLPKSALSFTSMPIDPATEQMVTLLEGDTFVEGISATRARFPGGYFKSLGELLATPSLSISQDKLEATPYLTEYTFSLDQSLDVQYRYAIPDEVYERIPQQLLSMVTIEDYPRMVIYGFAQTLSPAPRSRILIPGPTKGMVTNYQVTGESVTRSVVRFEGVNEPLEFTDLSVDSANSFIAIPQFAFRLKFPSRNTGLVNGTPIRFALTPGSALPSGLSTNRIYYVINGRVNDFQVSLAPNGGAINLVNTGFGTNLVSTVPRVVVESYQVLSSD